MAMGHPTPGLGYDKVSRHQKHLRSVSSAPPDIYKLRQMLKPVNAEDIQRIRQSARNDWSSELSHNERSVTTYDGLHSRKYLDQPTKCRIRPSSPTRLNKPHPEQVFLVTRLKKVKGCYEPQKAKLNQNNAAQRLQTYIHANKSAIDIATRNKDVPMQRPKTAHCVSDQARNRMRTVMGDVPAQATEAWIKLSNDTGKVQIMHSVEGKVRPKQPQYIRLPDYNSDRRKQYPSLRHQIKEINKKTMPKDGGEGQILSSHRWLKKAGQEESITVRNLLESLRNAPRRVPPNKGPHFHITDYSSMFTTASKPPHYDFQIHPEWHQPWHKQYVLTI